jgi:diguanylate cyclase (GGDEF)-like protein
VSLAGLTVVAFGTGTLDHTNLPTVAWAFIACLLVTEIRPVSWIRRGAAEVTASWTFAFALVLSSSFGVAVCTLWGVSFLSDALRKKPLDRLLFNSGQLALSLAAGAGVLTLLAGTHIQPDTPSVAWMGAAVVAAFVIFTTNGVLTGLVLALHTDRPIRMTLPAVVLLNLTTDGMLLGVAPIFVVVGRQAPALLPLLALTTWAVYRSACIAEARQFEATHDVLTGLPNRAEFHREVLAALRISELRGEGFAVAIIDLDSFKLVNDELGHDIGDQLLCEVAHRLDDNRRPADTVARLAGDEFAVLIRGVDGTEDAGLVAERLHFALGRPCSLRGFPITISASFGVASHPHHGNDLETLLRHADIAMYAAKHGDGGVRAYDSTNDRRRTGRISLLSELSTAIDADELVLEYQPKVSLATGEFTGAEALVRWDHPTLGRIRPDQFVPLAEQTDLMHPFTEWVLHAALADCARWQAAGHHLAVAVNVSAHNLRDGRFASKVADALQTARVSAERLELEITENTVMSDPGNAVATLSKVRALGARVAIDDFGTGYSSFATLRTLPVDEVKIDRSFVVSMVHDPGDLAIVQSLVELAHRLGLRTVAEGVETETVRDVLAGFGCDEGQGFLFMRPATSAQLLVALDRRTIRPALGAAR